MNRTRINLLVDVLAFACAVFMTATGFILRYVLPPGSGGVEGFGHGHGAMARPISLLWGLTRHEWGDIHYGMSIALLVVLALHLILHWRWIVCMMKGQPVQGSGLRVAVGLLALVALLAFAIAPFLSPVGQMTRGDLLQKRNTQETSAPLH